MAEKYFDQISKQIKTGNEPHQWYRNRIKETLKEAREKKTKKAEEAAYSALDRGAKKRVIHKNKAARLKSRLVKLIKRK